MRSFVCTLVCCFILLDPSQSAMFAQHLGGRDHQAPYDSASKRWTDRAMGRSTPQNHTRNHYTVNGPNFGVGYLPLYAYRRSGLGYYANNRCAYRSNAYSYYDPVTGYWTCDPFAYRSFSTVYYPPVIADASQQFGPVALWNQMGLNNGVQGNFIANQPQNNVQLAGAVGNANPGAQEALVQARILTRARKSIDFGDNYFRAEKFSSALRRYREATSAAPEFADAQFRRSFVEIALGRYDTASWMFERGLQLDPQWPASGFKLSSLFTDPLEFDQELQSLAREVTQKPNDTDALFLIGVMLHFDGKPARAEKFFEQSIRKQQHQTASMAFLPNPNPPEVAENQAPIRGREF